MAVEIIMPKLGMSMSEGTIVEWLKKENEEVKKGDPVVSISSDKLEKELEAPEDGIIQFAAKEDDVIAVGEAIGYVGAKGEEITKKDTQANGAYEEAGAALESPAEEDHKETKDKQEAFTSPSRRVRISPAAKKLAKTKGVDIETVQGSGPQGRITKEDVNKVIEELEQHNKNRQAPAKENPVRNESEKKPSVEAKPISGMRKIIAHRMHESLQSTAQLTIMRKADITPLLDLQSKLKEEKERVPDMPKLTLTDYIAKAVVLSLKNHQEMNSTMIDGKIYAQSDIHLGIATSLDSGLMVPVVTNAGNLSLGQISSKIKELSQKARGGSIDNQELQGSTFTITNLGASGVEYFTPILNPPETGILGVGSIQEAVILRDNQPITQKYLPLSLTFDHRVVDGEPASRFLDFVIKKLSVPHHLLFS
ncbi:dihydrolipoamide acetyltransferase family protein [Bacillus sp. FJAT-44742]|uniref:dihydrolipoamide acetyltransferase family protein n=1 Tax=Bacillus sp. FJAT-44742 TaxID=2014005 RepID=UPI000C235033|nr:dihydrolipoamide acetyltransferase family protein [Bacillus sp. FJAT-44742]